VPACRLNPRILHAVRRAASQISANIQSSPLIGLVRAGRSPSYIFRQLYDFKHGARAGEWSPLMAQVVSNLDQEDMLAIVAYLASLDP
jgi:cytochrome c553